MKMRKKVVTLEENVNNTPEEVKEVTKKDTKTPKVDAVKNESSDKKVKVTKKRSSVKSTQTEIAKKLNKIAKETEKQKVLEEKEREKERKKAEREAKAAEKAQAEAEAKAKEEKLQADALIEESNNAEIIINEVEAVSEKEKSNGKKKKAIKNLHSETKEVEYDEFLDEFPEEVVEEESKEPQKSGISIVSKFKKMLRRSEEEQIPDEYDIIEFSDEIEDVKADSGLKKEDSIANADFEKKFEEVREEIIKKIVENFQNGYHDLEALYNEESGKRDDEVNAIRREQEEFISERQSEVNDIRCLQNKKTDELIKEYNKKYEPLTLSGNELNEVPWAWEESPWPWEGV